MNEFLIISKFDKPARSRCVSLSLLLLRQKFLHSQLHGFVELHAVGERPFCYVLVQLVPNAHAELSVKRLTASPPHCFAKAQIMVHRIVERRFQSCRIGALKIHRIADPCTVP